MSDHQHAASAAYADPYRPAVYAAGWPAPPGTPQWGAPLGASESWGGQISTPWPSSAAVLTPMFSSTTAPPQPAWPGTSPTITQVPIPTGMSASVSQGNEEWVHVQQPPADWDRPRTPSRYDSSPVGSTSRFLSRQPSSRSRSVSRVSGDSSPSSGLSDLSRTRSFTGSWTVSEHDKRPPREWRSDFSMLRSPTLGAAIGSLLHLSPGRRPGSRRGMLRLGIHVI